MAVRPANGSGRNDKKAVATRDGHICNSVRYRVRALKHTLGKVLQIVIISKLDNLIKCLTCSD